MMSIGTYSRLIMQPLVLQFERTLIVADEDSQVSYLEGCTAPSYDKNQVTLNPICSAHLTQRPSQAATCKAKAMVHCS